MLKNRVLQIQWSVTEKLIFLPNWNDLELYDNFLEVTSCGLPKLYTKVSFNPKCAKFHCFSTITERCEGRFNTF